MQQHLHDLELRDWARPLLFMPDSRSGLGPIAPYYANIHNEVAGNNVIPDSNNIGANLLLDFADLRQPLSFPTTSNSLGFLDLDDQFINDDSSFNLDYQFISHNGSTSSLPQGYVMEQLEPPFLLDPIVDLVPQTDLVIQQEPNGHPVAILSFPCAQLGCTRSFKRSSDRIRHENSIHASATGLHICPIPGCRKSQDGGYSRRDKLTEHLWKKHADLGYTKGRW